MSRSWITVLSLAILILLALFSGILWIGGGLTHPPAWEFAAWVTGALAVVASAIWGLTKLLVSASQRKPNGGTAWTDGKVAISRSTAVLACVLLVLFGAVSGGIVTHIGSQIRSGQGATEDPSATAAVPSATPSMPTPSITPSPSEGNSTSPTPSPSPSPSPTPEPSEESTTSEETSDTSNSHRLTSLEPLNSGTSFSIGNATVNTQQYTQSILFGGCWSCGAEYNIERTWETFEATIGIDDNAEFDADVTFQVRTDGDLIASETLSLGESQEISVDIKNALRLRIDVETTGEFGRSWTAVWADPTLSK